MKQIRRVAVVAVALAMCACGPVQCAAGGVVQQTIVYENSGLILFGLVLFVGLLFTLALGGIFGGGGDRPR